MRLDSRLPPESARKMLFQVDAAKDRGFERGSRRGRGLAEFIGRFFHWILDLVKEFRKLTHQPLTLRGSEYAHAVQKLNKAIDRADRLLR